MMQLNFNSSRLSNLADQSFLFLNIFEVSFDL